MSDWELLLLTILAAVAFGAVMTTGIRFVFRGRTRLLSDDGGSVALRALTNGYVLALAFVLAASLQSFQNTLQQTDAEASTVVALGNLSRALPSPAGTQLRTELSSYANTVIHREFPAMDSGNVQPLDDNTALVRLYRTMAPTTSPGSQLASTASVQATFQQLSNLTSNRNARIKAAKTSLPALVWFLIIGGGVLLMFGIASVTFIDRPWPQFYLVTSIAILIAIVALVVYSLDTPFEQAGFFVNTEPMKAALASLGPLP